MSYSEDQLWELLRQADDMPYGSARTALVEQVMAHADAEGLAGVAFSARIAATDAYQYGGEVVKGFVTFSWFLAEFDRDPVRHQRYLYDVLWRFKWMISNARKFPEIPLTRINDLLDEMQRRYHEAGSSMHAVHAYRHRVAKHVGDWDTAERCYATWNITPRDRYSDCVGCDPTSKVSWLASQHRDEEAIALAEPVLAGRLTCREQPQGILTQLLLPYLRTGRLDEARDAHRRAYRLHQPNLADLSDIANHAEFCALTGNEARGLEIVQRHLRWLDEAPSPEADMIFASASAVVLRRVAESGAGVSVRRPARGEQPAAELDPATLAQDLATRALDLAARFDARNGTDHQSRLVRERLDATPLVDRLPLAPPGSRTRLSTVDGEAATATPAPVPAAAAATVPAAVPVTAAPDELLDLGEAALNEGRDGDAGAAWRAFEERYAGSELTPVQRGRYAEAQGGSAADAGDLPLAETCWRSAEQRYAEGGDEVRRQVVRGRLGALLVRTDRAEQGLPMVQASTTYLVTSAPRQRWCSAYSRLALALTLLGRLDEARDALSRVDDPLLALAPPVVAAYVLTQRAFLHGSAGRLDEAAAAAKAARERARGMGGDPLVAAAGTHASILEQLGSSAAAVEAYEEALRHASDPAGRRELALRRAGHLAGSERAAEVIDDLVEIVADRTAAQDTAVAMTARYYLAVAYLNVGRLLDAAELGEELVAVEKPSRDARHLLATVYRGLGQPDQAVEQLRAIADEYASSDDQDNLGGLLAEIGLILDRADRDHAAAVEFLAAAQAFARAGRVLDEVTNRRRHALSLLWSRDIPAAVLALSEVDTAATDLPELAPPGWEQPADWPKAVQWERAAVDFDAARILSYADRVPEAVERAGRSVQRFRGLGAVHPAARSGGLHADLLLRDGRPAEAESAAQLALADLPADADADELLELVELARDRQAKLNEQE